MSEVRGVAALRRRFENLSAEQEKGIKRELFSGGVNIQSGAKRRVRVDRGPLRNSIAVEVLNGGFEVRVGTNIVYAKAEEFGRMPGSHPPVAPLIAWAKRHGLADPEGVAWAIARKMEREGTKPHPFLFPAFEEERPQIIERMDAVLKNTTRRAR